MKKGEDKGVKGGAPSKMARKDQRPSESCQSWTTYLSWLARSGLGQGWKETESVSAVDLAKERRVSSEERRGSGREVYFQRASSSGQPISVYLVVEDMKAVKVNGRAEIGYL